MGWLTVLCENDPSQVKMEEGGIHHGSKRLFHRCGVNQGVGFASVRAAKNAVTVTDKKCLP